MCHDKEKGGSIWCYTIEDWVSEKDTGEFENQDFETSPSIHVGL